MTTKPTQIPVAFAPSGKESVAVNYIREQRKRIAGKTRKQLVAAHALGGKVELHYR